MGRRDDFFTLPKHTTLTRKGEQWLTDWRYYWHVAGKPEMPGESGPAVPLGLWVSVSAEKVVAIFDLAPTDKIQDGKVRNGDIEHVRVAGAAALPEWAKKLIRKHAHVLPEDML